MDVQQQKNPPNLLLYWTSSRILLDIQQNHSTGRVDVQQTYFSTTSVATEAHALAHNVYWMSSRGYFSATGHLVEQMIWAITYVPVQSKPRQHSSSGSYTNQIPDQVKSNFFATVEIRISGFWKTDFAQKKVILGKKCQLSSSLFIVHQLSSTRPASVK